MSKILIYNKHKYGGNMENEQINWSKALLYSYSNLEQICDAIDKTVLNYGIGSFNSNQTMIVADKILSLISRKKRLINIKVLVDNVLNNISTSSAKILTVRYIDKVKTEIASKVLNMSNRNFFRRLNQAVHEFATEIKKQGFDSKVLHEKFKSEFWILEIYNSYNQKQNERKNLDNFNIIGLDLNSIKSKKVSYGVYR